MFCPNCGKKIPNDSKFCFHCGYEVNGLSSLSERLTDENQGSDLGFLSSARSFKVPFDCIFGALLLLTFFMNIHNDSFYHIEQGLVCLYLLYSAFFWYKYYRNVFLAIPLLVVGIFLNPFTKLFDRSDYQGIVALSGIVLIIASGVIYCWRLKKEVNKDSRSTKQKWLIRAITVLVSAFLLLMVGGIIYQTQMKPASYSYTPSSVHDSVGNRIVPNKNGTWSLQTNPDLVFVSSDKNSYYYNLKTKRKYTPEEIKKIYPEQAIDHSKKKNR